MRCLPLLTRCVALSLLLASAGAAAVPDFVVLVRHAEKSTEPGADPALSAAGRARADALALALRDAAIDAVISTQFQRTRATAEPLARQRGLTVQIVEASRDPAHDHIAATAAAVREHSGGVLVVGHSNTVPALIRALGGPLIADLCESSFQQAFVMTLDPPPVRLVRLRYGTTDPEPAAADCD